MNHVIAKSSISLIVMCCILVSGVAYASDKVTRYEVTITNITRGQVISPPIVISHKKDFQLFSLGDPASPASPGLALLAEDGMTGLLESELNALDSVFQTKTAGGGIMPGASVTVKIETKRRFRFLSAAGMLVNSNDAFAAMRGVYARSWATVVVDAPAYDAGSEVNSENCDFIPGPACVGGGGQRDTVGAEGYVYIHSGIHGIADLDPAEYDWRNPVATIEIQRVK